MYHKYCDSLFDIRYLYCDKKYHDVPVHRCIVAGLFFIIKFLPWRAPCLCKSTPCLPEVLMPLLLISAPCSGVHIPWGMTTYDHPAQNVTFITGVCEMLTENLKFGYLLRIFTTEVKVMFANLALDLLPTRLHTCSSAGRASHRYIVEIMGSNPVEASIFFCYLLVAT